MKNFFLTKIIFIIFLYATIPTTGMDLKGYTIYVNPNKNTELVTQRKAKILCPGFNFDDKHDDKLIRIIPIFVAHTNGIISTNISDPDQYFNFLVPYDFLLQKVWNIKSIQTKGLNINNENLLRYQYHHKKDLLKQIADKINQENMFQQQREAQSMLELTRLIVLLENQLNDFDQALKKEQKKYNDHMVNIKKNIEELNDELAQSNTTQTKNQFSAKKTPPTRISSTQVIMYCCSLVLAFSLALLYTYFTSTNNTIFWFL